MNYEEWCRLGERLQLSGAELGKFVQRKEDEFLARQERAQRREDEKRVLEMQHESMLKEQELELERLRASKVGTETQSKVLRPKLPKFDETQDDMDAYIERFERFARSQGWSEDTWAMSLSSLLTGRGLEVYTSLSPEDACNYTALKIAVLKRYELTEEGFRGKFRRSRPEVGETVFQYIARLKRYFMRWIEMAEANTSVGTLCDLMVVEQFKESCSTELAVFLRERAPKSIADVTRLAEQFVEAHGGKIANDKTAKRFNDKEHQSGSAVQQQSVRREAEVSRHDSKTCFICNKAGHIAKNCRNKAEKSRASGQSTDRKIFAACIHSEMKNSTVRDNIEDGKLKLENGESLPIISGCCTVETLEGTRNLDLQNGFVGRNPVKVLRDTGCELAAVRRELVQDGQYLEKKIVMITIDGEAKVVPMAKVWVSTPYFEGEIEAMVPKSLICDLVLGNMPGVQDKPDKEWLEKNIPSSVAAVMTRAQLKKAEQPLKALNVPKPSCDREIDIEKLRKAQKDDQSLAKLWELAGKGDVKVTKGGAEYKYAVMNRVLYRIFDQKKRSYESEIRQVVVPLSFRRRVMELAHESIVGGHLSAKKTEDRITTSFYWPGIVSDVIRFCRSCDVCQRMIPKGRIRKVPLGVMPVIEEPFHRVAMDLIGPISPSSDGGNRYILTLVDYATRYPEAVALPRIDTERVAEAMLEVFSRVGFPTEILSDRGSQFTSDLMKEVSRIISVKQIFTTPYNPKCNGLCERINGVLKSMLKKMCQERPKDWDRYLAAVLFAYREVPQASTGFSPFELLYGRRVRGPMQILKELWTGEDSTETYNTYQYVLELKHRLEDTCKIATENMEEAGRKYKHHYDKSARRRFLKVGEKVLVLLPTDKNKMLLQWRGPFEVVGKVNQTDYQVQLGTRVATYHINLLKKYEVRPETATASVAIIEAEGGNSGAVDEDDLIHTPEVTGQETYTDVKISKHLSTLQQQQVRDLVKEFKAIFTEIPGTTSLTEHRVELTNTTPIKVKQYSIPYAKRKDIDSEIESMLKVGVIEPAVSEYNSPIVMVKKKDGSHRFCIDFRRLNAVTKFDNEPMGNIEDIMAKLRKDMFFTKIDLAKGYWQIPVKKECRHLTAFSTDKACFQFKKMPFGMVNSGATFNRMMRQLLEGCENVDNYVDDIIGHTVTWAEHLKTIRQVFTRISKANLTVRPTKCMIGFDNIGFTGHSIGNGVVKMEEEKIERIHRAEIPKTKRQVRAFLGLAGYYRKFIPMFAQSVAPLTDLTKKGQPHIVCWGVAQEKAFNKIKSQLTKAPILRLPDFDREFILQTDASDVGVGAALMQKYDDGIFPVAFASKKLLQRERNYSVTEREGLAIIFGVKKFQKYLYGKEFVIQTDHSALSHIQRSKLENGRLMRWALYLQSYRFRIEAIKGTDNHVADYLSRQESDENTEDKDD